MMSLEQALNLYHLLSQTLDNQVPGDLVELGCYRGLTGVLFQKTLDQHQSDKILHLYDSFQGLPDKAAEDQAEAEWTMRDCDRKDNRRVGKGWFQTPQDSVLEQFKAFQVKAPQIHPGWFDETLPKDLPDAIAFAHLDGDFYESTLIALEEVYPRLSAGGVMVIDDYCDPEIHGHYHQFPGVKRACDLFFQDKPEDPFVLVAGKDGYHAYIRKLAI